MSLVVGLRLVVLALGATQITGYGTLYYGLGVLAPAVAQSFAWTEEWSFGALALSFLAGGFVAPAAGRFADRFGSGRLMSGGSAFAALALLICALAPDAVFYLAGLILLGIASSFTQYSLAFAALVQIAPRQAQRSITYLTLIAGFSSTIFWPATSYLNQHLGWNAVYLIFAGANVLICLPLHLWLSRLTKPVIIHPQPIRGAGEPQADIGATGAIPPALRRKGFRLMVLALALFSFVNSAMLIHMLPILQDLGLGVAGIWISTFFGPAQVLSRFATMLFGKDMQATGIALISAVCLPLALFILVASAPIIGGSFAFALVFGLATGLNSIVQGTLPLYLFGHAGYGARLGRLTAVRLIMAASSPFIFSIISGRFGTMPALWMLVLFGLASLAATLWIVRLVSRSSR